MTRDTISSALATIIFDHLCSVLTTGYSSRGPGIALPTFANRIVNRYARLTVNGSFGVWRKSDIFDMSMEQFDESGKVTDRNQRVSSFVCGIATSQSSIESFNALTKKMLDRKPKETIELMDFFGSFIAETVKRDYEKYGFSYSCLPYGMGTDSGRYKSTKHSESILLGMTFLGYSSYTEFQYDQRSYYVTDVSDTMIFYIYCISYLTSV